MSSVWSELGLLSIQRVVMLRPPLQELDCSASVVRPPLATESFWGLCLPEHKETVHPEVEVSLPGAEVASSTQSTARLVQFWSLAGPFLRRVNPLHSEGLRGGVIGLPCPSWWPVSGQDTSLLRVSSRGWGLRPESLCYVVDQDAIP